MNKRFIWRVEWRLELRFEWSFEWKVKWGLNENYIVITTCYQNVKSFGFTGKEFNWLHHIHNYWALFTCLYVYYDFIRIISTYNFDYDFDIMWSHVNSIRVWYDCMVFFNYHYTIKYLYPLTQLHVGTIKWPIISLIWVIMILNVPLWNFID